MLLFALNGLLLVKQAISRHVRVLTASRNLRFRGVALVSPDQLIELALDRQS